MTAQVRTRARRSRRVGPERGPVRRNDLVLGTIFALAIAFIPWESLKKAEFTDRTRFIDNFYQGAYWVDGGGGAVSLWQSEYLWHQGITELATSIGSYETVFALLSAFVAFLFCGYGMLRATSVMYLAILISPMFIDLVFSQVRSALAFALLYSATLLPRRWWGLAVSSMLVGAAIFIHQFAIVPVGLGLGFLVVRRTRISEDLKGVLVMAPLVVSLLALTVFREAILAALSDRRADAGDGNAGGIALALMVFSYGAPAWIYPSTIRSDLNAYLVFAASVLQMGFFLADLEGGTRIVAMALPALVALVSKLPDDQVRRGFLVYLLACNAVHFAYWISTG